MGTFRHGLWLAAWLSAASAAQAADFSGLLSGGYQNISTSGTSADGYRIEGAGLANFGGLNAQADAGYQKVSLSGVSLKDAGGEGDLFWRGRAFTLGGSFRYDDLRTNVTSISDHLTSFGAFAEVYLGPHLTLQAKGGKIDGAFSGSYVAVAAKYYIFRQLSIQPIYQYSDLGSLGHDNSYGGAMELFISPRLPLAITASYAHSSSSGVGGDSVLISLSYWFGADRDLVAWDRTGPTAWNGAYNL